MSEQQQQVQYPQFKVHTRTGSVKFTLKPAHFAGETFDSKEGEVRVLKQGHLMVEMANAAGNPDNRGYVTYDWANKVSMKLSDTDIQQILSGLNGGACRIVHDPNKAHGDPSRNLPHSCLELSKGERFGYFMSVSRGEKRAKCPVSDIDAATLQQLLTRALVRIYGW